MSAWTLKIDKQILRSTVGAQEFSYEFQSPILFAEKNKDFVYVLLKPRDLEGRKVIPLFCLNSKLEIIWTQVSPRDEFQDNFVYLSINEDGSLRLTSFQGWLFKIDSQSGKLLDQQFTSKY